MNIFDINISTKHTHTHTQYYKLSTATFLLSSIVVHPALKLCAKQPGKSAAGHLAAGIMEYP